MAESTFTKPSDTNSYKRAQKKGAHHQHDDAERSSRCGHPQSTTGGEFSRHGTLITIEIDLRRKAISTLDHNPWSRLLREWKNWLQHRHPCFHEIRPQQVVVVSLQPLHNQACIRGWNLRGIESVSFFKPGQRLWHVHNCKPLWVGHIVPTKERHSRTPAIGVIRNYVPVDADSTVVRARQRVRHRAVVYTCPCQDLRRSILGW